VRVVYVLSHAGEEWKGERGRLDGELLRRVLFLPEEGSVVFLCGPPG
jgi:nitrate reductase (NAD(P)H)